MTKKIFITMAVIFTLAGCFPVKEKIDYSHLSTEKQAAMGEWNSIYSSAEFHRGALNDMNKIIRRAETNIPELIEISRMISYIPFHTVPLVNIAEEAAHSKNTSIDFLKIAELAVIKLSDSESIEKLAEYAAGLKSGDDLSEYYRRYDSLRSTADAESIEEAIVKVREMIDQAKESASSL